MREPMTRLTAAALALTLLTACGADGPPTAPGAKSATPPAGGLSVTGDAYVGVSKRIN